jgi:acylphosphatase
VRVVVIGRVQGVGFRFFVRERAMALGLSGYVRNLADGRSVEVAAEGLRSHLELLLRALAGGPPAAHVTRVDTEWCDGPLGVEGFVVR